MDQVAIHQSTRQRKTHCIRGHERTPDNLSGKKCRICDNLWHERNRREAGVAPRQFCKHGDIDRTSSGRCRTCEKASRQIYRFTDRGRASLIAKARNQSKTRSTNERRETKQRYNQSEDGIAIRRTWEREYRSRPEVQEHQRILRQRPEFKESRRNYVREYQRTRYANDSEYRDSVLTKNREYRRRKREQATQQ